MCVYAYAYWADVNYAYILVWIYLSCTVLSASLRQCKLVSSDIRLILKCKAQFGFCL